MTRKVLKILAWICGIMTGLVFVTILIGAILYWTADFKEPDIVPENPEAMVTDSLRICGDSWLRHADNGLWEMKLTGAPQERGEAYGKMASDLLYKQEEVFVTQIYKFVPDKKYLRFLHKLVVAFNRNMGKNVFPEMRTELAAMSLSCSHEFDDFGSPYERQMNYHSAHDIGHAMQDYMLVGCSSFAVRGSASADSALLAGRNFDFSMGEDFARNKVVEVMNPENGYGFIFVTWPGMQGVVSGMNETGLTVTINAGKLEIPHSSGTPISILCREILQYAGTIDEAYAIAAKRRTFVSESILICSAADGRAVVIEKSPRQMSVFDPMSDGSDILLCTNHFQSEAFEADKKNLENIRMSDSKPRWDRMQELVDSLSPIDLTKAVRILRDRKGVHGIDVGYGNELAINQLIGHHSVVFKPSELKMAVSVGPWQCGKFVEYDLREALEAGPYDVIAHDVVPEDPFLSNADYPKFVQWRGMTERMSEAVSVARDGCYPAIADSVWTFVNLNPGNPESFVLAGNLFEAMDVPNSALLLWSQALLRPMKPSARESLQEKIAQLKGEKDGTVSKNMENDEKYDVSRFKNPVSLSRGD